MLNKVVYLNREKCKECGNCITVCPLGVIEMEEGWGISLETNFCSGCGKCISACPEDALKLI